jgi:predicted alpha/beta superfamily hydrolase
MSLRPAPSHPGTDGSEGSRATLEVATVVVRYPASRGQIVLRGNSPPLDWEQDFAPTTVDGDRRVFRVPVPVGRTVELKPYRTDGRWAYGTNLVVSGRDAIEVTPCFEREHGHLLPWHEIPREGKEPLKVRVLLPPSYEEHEGTRHSVLYALDGQALWSDQQDPFGIWSLDSALNELWSLGVLEDIIVVSIDTSSARLDKLGPVPDVAHGGGHGAEFLGLLTRELIPLVDRTYRTQAHRDGRTVLGASMGGLFSLFAGWTRSDLFGQVICLSSSFWWANRWLVRLVEEGPCPEPRPRIYLDSGATASPFAEDANLRDGQHLTRAMTRALVELCWRQEHDLFVMTFPGDRHDASAWGARVAIPLQLFFSRPM